MTNSKLLRRTFLAGAGAGLSALALSRLSPRATAAESPRCETNMTGTLANASFDFIAASRP